METVGWRQEERREDELLRWSDKSRVRVRGMWDVGARESV